MSRRHSDSVVIDIEGIIGVPEEWQYEQGASDEKVATFERFREAVRSMSEIDAAKVRVNIRSIGGNVNDALLIYETLCALDASVETHCYGYVASAATIIAQAAGEGARYVSSDSLYLIHNSTTVVDGNCADVQHTADLLGKTDDRIAAIYAMRSGRAVESFVELMGRDGGRGEWLSPEETIEAGLADRVEHVSPLKKAGRKIVDLASRAFGAGNYASRMTERSSGDMQREDAGRAKPAVRRKLLGIDGLNDRGSADRTARPTDPGARLRVKPTATQPREDPPLGVRTPRPNEAAYMQDVECLREVVS